MEFDRRRVGEAPVVRNPLVDLELPRLMPVPVRALGIDDLGADPDLGRRELDRASVAILAHLPGNLHDEGVHVGIPAVPHLRDVPGFQDVGPERDGPLIHVVKDELLADGVSRTARVAPERLKDHHGGAVSDLVEGEVHGSVLSPW